MSLIKNSWFNLLGLAVPSLIALPVMGHMARTLDREIFGLFTLSIAFLGYSTIFDGGLSRAVIREISINLKNREEQRLIVGSAVRVSLLVGFAVAATIALASAQIADMLNVTNQNRSDVVAGIKILSPCIPVILINATLMALLEGKQDFRSVNIIRATGFSLVFLAPTLLISYTPSFLNIAIGVALARLAMMALTYHLFFRSADFHPTNFNKHAVLRLYRFGGWITISNIIGPIIEYFDRFIIASIHGTESIIYYTAPAEINSRLLSIPGAISRSLFPALSGQTKNHAIPLLRRAFSYQLVTSAAIALPTAIFSREIITIWLGREFTQESAPILFWLAIGFFFNGLASIPFTYLQASGHARVTAVIHLVEVIPYILLLGILTSAFGLTGGAIAWSIRVVADFCLMSIFSLKELRGHGHDT